MKQDMDKIISTVGNVPKYDPNGLPSSGNYQLVTQVEIRDTLERLMRSQDEEARLNRKRFAITTAISAIAALAAILAAIPSVLSLLHTIASLF